MDDQPDTDETPTTEKLQRDRALRQEAKHLAAESADRAEIAEIRSLLGEPWADLPP